MAIDYRGLKHAKPEPRKKTKGRKDRAEDARIKDVRQQCVDRDGYCRICDWENNPTDTHEGGDGYDALPYPKDQWLAGLTEWAHLGEKKRARTRGMSPEIRHTTEGSLMLCSFHHRAYDAGRITIAGDNANESLHFGCAQ